MKKIITYNVSGKCYQISRTLIEQQDKSLLYILLKEKERNNDESDIFIDRDYKMFRWILHYVRTGDMIDHRTVKVPLYVWQKEFTYYFPEHAEFPMESNANYLKEPNEIRDSVIQEYIDESNDKKTQRELIYIDLLKYLFKQLNEGVQHFAFINRKNAISDKRLCIQDVPDTIANECCSVVIENVSEWYKWMEKCGFKMGGFGGISLTYISNSKQLKSYIAYIPACLIAPHLENETEIIGFSMYIGLSQDPSAFRKQIKQALIKCKEKKNKLL